MSIHIISINEYSLNSLFKVNDKTAMNFFIIIENLEYNSFSIVMKISAYKQTVVLQCVIDKQILRDKRRKLFV